MWYDPQGQLVSTGNENDVTQAVAFDGLAASLIFHEYEESQSGRYECRVNSPRKRRERLAVCIGECHIHVMSAFYQ